MAYLYTVPGLSISAFWHFVVPAFVRSGIPEFHHSMFMYMSVVAEWLEHRT